MDVWFVLLVLTWAVVVPYLALFPPQLLFIKRKLRARRAQQTMKQCSLKPQWEVRNSNTSGNGNRKQSTAKGGEHNKTPTKSGRSSALVSNDSLVNNFSGLKANLADGGTLYLPRWIIPRGAPTIVALVNRKSGGQLGAATLRNLQKLLHPAQLFDLGEIPDIAAILRSFTGDYKLLVCGGDGTVSWAMDAATRCGIRPPMAILPLGTGNDLSRALGWGSGFGMSDVTEDSVKDVLVNMHRASAVQRVDRWRVTFTPADGGPATSRMMINYFSIGVDAEISLKFHRERIDHPERFSSQTKNVVKYAMLGFEAAFEGRPLNGTARVRCDGQPLEIKDGWKGAIISSVPYYHGGKNFWGEPEDIRDTYGPALLDDGKLECMGLAGTFHIGLCNIHVDNALRVGQGHVFEVELRDDCAVQVDGEPFPQPPCTIRFERADQYPMLRLMGA